jgi:hypothetical protein
MRIRRLLLISFCLLSLVSMTSLISWTSHSRAVRSGSEQTREVEAAARKAWPAFFAEFRAAVNKRDRSALRNLMSDPFNGPPKTREDAFKQWDDPKVSGWLKLRRVLAQGAVQAGKPDEGDPSQLRPTMISPPASELNSKRYKGWWAAFEFQEDGKWYCIQFVSPPTFLSDPRSKLW